MTPFDSNMRSSVRDLLTVVFRHKGKITFLFLIISASVIFLTLTAADIYKAEANLIVRFGRENLSVDLSQNERTTTMLYDRQSQASQVNSEMNILTSRFLVEQVVDKVGVETILTNSYEPELGAVPPEEPSFIDNMKRSVKEGMQQVFVATGFSVALSPREKAIEEILENLSAEAEPNSNIIRVQLLGENKYLAQHVLNLLIEDYLDRHIEVNAAQASPDFFEKQANEAWDVVRAAEDALESYREDHNIVELDRQQETLLLQVSEIEKEKELAAADVASSRSRVAELENALEGRPIIRELSRTTGLHNFAGDILKEKLISLRVEEQDLSDRYHDGYPPLVSLRNQIAEAETMLAQEVDTHTEVSTGIDLNVQTLELTLDTQRAQLAAEEARLASLEKDVAQHKADLDALGAVNVRLHALERARTTAEQEYLQFRENLHRSRISSELDRVKVSNVSVVQPAEEPLAPVKPRRALIIAAGLIMAILISFGIAYMVEYFDDTFKTDADVGRWLGLPVLASVGEREYPDCT